MLLMFLPKPHYGDFRYYWDSFQTVDHGRGVVFLQLKHMPATDTVTLYYSEVISLLQYAYIITFTHYIAIKCYDISCATGSIAIIFLI